MLSKKFLSVFFLSCLLYLFFPNIAKAASSDCKIKGGSYSNCYAPPRITWDRPNGKVFNNVNDAAEDFFVSYLSADKSNVCQYGCAIKIEPYTDGSKNITAKYALYINPTSTSQGTPEVWASESYYTNPNCYGTDHRIYDTNAAGELIWACSAATVPSGSNSIATTSTSKIFNKSGTGCSCDPVDLTSHTLTDSVVDYKNNSPFPIVWSRTYSSTVSGKRWIFNYERSLTLTQADALHAYINLQREDGQIIDVYGTRSSATDNWVWSPNPAGQVPSVSIASPMTATIITSMDLTSIEVINNQDEQEYYDTTGKLTQLKDLHGNYLNFTYTENKLTLIQDNAGRSLTLTYNNQSMNSQGNVGLNATPYNYNYYPSKGLYLEDVEPLSVSDGTQTVAYDWTTNTSTTNYIVLLSNVQQSDGSMVSYSYNTSGNWLNTYDENNNLYQTYTYSGNNVTSTVLGNSLDVYGFSGSYITLPNKTLIALGINGNNQIVSVSRPCLTCSIDNHKSTTYDSYGDPIQLKDFNNNTEVRTYDTTRSLILTDTLASGTSLAKTSTYMWDSRFRLPDQIVEPVQTPAGAGTLTSVFNYDNLGNLLSWTKTAANTGGYSLVHSGSATYNSFGQNLTTTDAKGYVTQYTYDNSGNLASVINPLSQTTTLGGYDTSGNIGWIQDPNGLKSSFTYNLRKQMTSMSKGCDTGGSCHEETYTVHYSPIALADKITSPNGKSLSFIYDTAHRLIETDVLDSSGNVLGKKILTLDNSGTVTVETYKDAQGNTIKALNYTTDDLDRIKAYVDTATKPFTSTLNDQGLLTSDSDPLTHGNTYQYDTLNRLIKKIYADNNSEALGYGVGDEVVTKTDALNHSTTYTYDGFGRVLSKTSPDSGKTVYTYDLNGNVLTETDARNKVITFTYDALDRELTESGTSGETIVKAYDTCLNGIGKLCAVTNRTGLTSFTYDLWGRIKSKTEVMNGLTFVLSYSYDNAGQLTSITYPSGKVLTQTFVNGNIASLSDAGMPILSNATYDAWSRLFGWTWNSGRQASFVYDMDGNVNTITYGTTVQNYGYDLALKMNGLTQTSPAYSMSYGYDNRDRLTSSNIWGSYTYDANSNRKTLLGTLGPFIYGISTTSNQYISLNSNANVLDASGNLTSLSGKTYTYDDWSRMRSITNGGVETDYGINGLGERVVKSSGTTKYYYIYAGVGQLVGVYDQNGNAVEELVYLGSRPVASVRGNSLNNVYSVETDNTMTPTRVIDLNNTVVWSWEGKEPFGLSVPTSTAGFTFNLRFPGQWFDVESGLIQNGFRDYDPMSGRYVETDPLGLGAGMNDYGYVGGSPLNGIDSSGLILNPIDQTPNGTGVYNYNLSINFLKNNSSTAKAYIERLENSSIIFNVYVNNYSQHLQQNETSFYKHEVNWTDDLSVYAPESNGCEHTMMFNNPSITLIHELGHLTGVLESNVADAQYHNPEERRVITGLEAEVVHEIYGVDFIRDSHNANDDTFMYTSSPISSFPMNSYELHPVAYKAWQNIRDVL